MTLGKIMMLKDFVDTLNDEIELAAALAVIQNKACKTFYDEKTHKCERCILQNVCIGIFTITEGTLKGVKPE